jgi:hypothetical protein
MATGRNPHPEKPNMGLQDFIDQSPRAGVGGAADDISMAVPSVQSLSI